MYFETGQGSALVGQRPPRRRPADLEARAYAVARRFKPLLVNTVVGFIGPEYLYDGKQIIRAGLEDHFCGKLLGLPMGCDVCYTNHAEADQDDMDNLLTLLAAAGCNYVMGVPGADDIMLNYQTTSFHDALYVRRLLGLKPAPEFEAWLQAMGMFDRTRGRGALPPQFQRGGWQRPASHERASSSAIRGTSCASSPPPASRWAAPACSMPTAPQLAFQLAHAQARDAVHLALDDAGAGAALTAALGLPCIRVHSAAPDRATYLRRPDLGRRLDRGIARRAGASPGDLRHRLRHRRRPVGAGDRAACAAVPALLARRGWPRLSVAPLVIVRQGRVAVGDEVAQLLGAKLVVVMIGERPGLSSPDSMGLYLTWQPRGRHDRRTAQLHLECAAGGPR